MSPVMNQVTLLVEQWRNGVMIEHIAQNKAAAYCLRRHRALGLAATVSAALAGASGFATLAEHTTWASWVAGIFGVVAAALAAAQSFLGYQELADTHDQASIRYGDLRRRIESMLVKTAVPTQAELDEIRSLWNSLNLESPSTSAAIHRKAKKEVRPAVADAPAYGHQMPPSSD